MKMLNVMMKINVLRITVILRLDVGIWMWLDPELVMKVIVIVFTDGTLLL